MYIVIEKVAEKGERPLEENIVSIYDSDRLFCKSGRNLRREAEDDWENPLDKDDHEDGGLEERVREWVFGKKEMGAGSPCGEILGDDQYEPADYFPEDFMMNYISHVFGGEEEEKAAPAYQIPGIFAEEDYIAHSSEQEQEMPEEEPEQQKPMHQKPKVLNMPKRRARKPALRQAA